MTPARIIIAVLWAGTVLLLVGALVASWSAPVLAHDAIPTAAKPLGWSYPFSCCSGIDCRAVPAKAISERPEGYVINRTGEVVGY